MAKPTQLGRWLRQWRRDRGWSLRELAEACGLYHKTLTAWESGERRNPSIFHFARAVDPLNYDIWIVDRERCVLVERIDPYAVDDEDE